MRIIHLGKSYPPSLGGIETVTRDLVEGTNRRGIVCDVIVASDGRGRVSETIGTSGHYYRVTRAETLITIASTPISIDYVRTFLKVCKKYDLLIIHLPNPLACFALFLSGFRGHVGLIWHSDIIRQKNLIYAFRWLQTWTIKRANFVIGATPAHLEESDNAELFQGKANIIPFGLAPEHIGAEAHSQRTREDGRIRIFALGRLVYYKGFDVLVEAMARLDDRYELVIAGTGPLRRALEDNIWKLGVSHRVRLVGAISADALQVRFAECDIFCLPSIERSEMFGLVLLEAMAFGKPIVSTAIPRSGVRYVNRDGVTGITVPPKDPSALAAAIRVLGENPTLRRQYGSAARTMFATEYTVDKMVDRHIALYRKYAG